MAAVTGLVVGVDGGGSMTRAVALTLDGTVVRREEGPGASPHFFGVDTLGRDRGRRGAAASLGRRTRPPRSTSTCPPWICRPRSRSTGPPSQSCRGRRARTVVENDLLALLRSGTDAPDAVAVVCGTGINAIGVRADGPPGAVRLARTDLRRLGRRLPAWVRRLSGTLRVMWMGEGRRRRCTPTCSTGMGVGSIAELTEQLHFGTAHHRRARRARAARVRSGSIRGCHRAHDRRPPGRGGGGVRPRIPDQTRPPRP